MPDRQERLFEVGEVDAPEGRDEELCDRCADHTDQPVDVDGELLCEACAHPVSLPDPRPVVTVDTGGLL